MYVIYQTFSLDVIQGLMNGAPYENRTHHVQSRCSDHCPLGSRVVDHLSLSCVISRTFSPKYHHTILNISWSDFVISTKSLNKQWSLALRPRWSGYVCRMGDPLATQNCAVRRILHELPWPTGAPKEVQRLAERASRGRSHWPLLVFPIPAKKRFSFLWRTHTDLIRIKKEETLWCHSSQPRTDFLL